MSEQIAATYSVARRQVMDSRRACGCIHVYECLCMYICAYIYIYMDVHVRVCECVCTSIG